MLTLFRRLFPGYQDETPALTTAFWTILLCVTGAKLAFVFATPLREVSMSAWLLDDSYITMRVARNVGLGLGFSFDGVHPTTGVSPLWTYLTAAFHAFAGRDVAATLTLLASTAFGGVAAALTFDIARSWTKNAAVAWTSLVLVLLMPVQFFNALNGMETAFFTSLLLGAFALFLRMDDAKKPMLHGLGTGVLLGAAFLTRADAVFAIAAVGLVAAIRWIREPSSRGRVFGWLAGVAIAVACCAAAFLVWQWLQSGSWHPDNQVGRRSIALAKHSFDFGHFSLPRYLAIVAWNVFQLEDLWSLSLGASLLGLLGAVHVLSDHRTSAFGWLTVAYTFLFGITLVGYQWYFPDFHGLRYLNPASHVALVAVAALAVRASDGAVARRYALPAFVAATLALSWYRYYDLARSPAWAQDMGLFGQSSPERQESFWGTFDCINEHLPANAVIAARDHGRLSYFTDRRVQDIAGILDPGVLAAQANGELPSYLRSRGVGYVFLPEHKDGVDNIFEDLRAALRLTPVAACPPRNPSEYRLYKISWPAADSTQ